MTNDRMPNPDVKASGRARPGFKMKNANVFTDVDLRLIIRKHVSTWGRLYRACEKNHKELACLGGM